MLQPSELLDRDRIADLLAIALARGADFGEVYAEYTVTTEITMDEGQVKPLTCGILAGVGIRAVRGETTGYAYSDDFEMTSLRETARTAAAVAGSAQEVRPRPFRTGRAGPPFVLQRAFPVHRDEAYKVEICRRADQAARSVDARIHNARVIYGDTQKLFLVANSDGVYEEDEHSVCRLALSVLALDGARRESASRREGGAVEADHFENEVPEALGRGAAQAALRLLRATRAPAGPMPVVLSPGWGGVLVHECFGHSLEGDGIRKKTSLRAGQLGTRVAAPGVDIYDDASVPWSRGSFRVDDEGTPGQKTRVVEDGILRGYLWDLLNARLEGEKPTGNGRRSSYRDYPIPRMTNTYIGAGKTPPSEILASVKRGLYCSQMGGGSVSPADGNFSFQVTEGFLIEQGELTTPVSSATLTGNGADAMFEIELLGDDLEIDRMSGTCGKAGQWKPVGVGQPTVKFRRMTVGGRA